MKLTQKFSGSFSWFLPIFIFNAGVALLFRLWELIYMGDSRMLDDIFNGLVGDLIILAAVSFPFMLLFALISLASRKAAFWISGLISLAYWLMMVPVQAYYHQNNRLADVVSSGYRAGETFVSIIKELDIINWIIPFFILGIIASFALIKIISLKNSFKPWVGTLFFIVALIAFPVAFEVGTNTDFLTRNKTRINKSFFFTRSATICFLDQVLPEIPKRSEVTFYQSITPEAEYLEPNLFPFLKTHTASSCTFDALGLPEPTMRPNFVIIVVEGLSNEFLQPTFGSNPLMPFLAQLAGKSLYWPNMLSTSARWHGILPSVTAGLPSGQAGFTQLPVIPFHFSLFNIFGANGYKTGYFSGQWNWQLSTDKYLEAGNPDTIVDAGKFPSTYEKVITGDENYFWGYNDRALFALYRQVRSYTGSPRFDVVQTGSMRSPYALENESRYDRKFAGLVEETQNDQTRRILEENQERIKAIMFTDDVLMSFFDQAAAMPGFENTIFIITGNYPMAVATGKNNLEKYNVPLLLYSENLKSGEIKHEMRSHNDLYHTLTDYMSSDRRFRVPVHTLSIGQSLCDTIPSSFIPFLDVEGQFAEMYHDGFFLSEDRLAYRVGDDLQTDLVTDPDKQSDLISLFRSYKYANRTVGNGLMPDSIYYSYFDYTLLKDTVISAQRIKGEYYNILEDLNIDAGRYFLDIQMENPYAPMGDVFVVYEVRDKRDSLLEWENFGIPSHKSDFGVRVAIDHFKSDTISSLQVFLWNESPLPYSVDKIRTILYKSNEPIQPPKLPANEK